MFYKKNCTFARIDIRAVGFRKTLTMSTKDKIYTDDDVSPHEGRKRKRGSNGLAFRELEDNQDKTIQRNLSQSRLTALGISAKHERGEERVIALVEMVDYCKNCVSWEDAKSIVAMLYKLLRKDATEEDYALLDSVEEEFRQRFQGHVTHVQGDLVRSKHVKHEVNGVAPGATGINVNKEEQ